MNQISYSVGVIYNWHSWHWLSLDISFLILCLLWWYSWLSLVYFWNSDLYYHRLRSYSTLFLEQGVIFELLLILHSQPSAISYSLLPVLELSRRDMSCYTLSSTVVSLCNHVIIFTSLNTTVYVCILAATVTLFLNTTRSCCMSFMHLHLF